jgi:uncharacterized protein (DUF305 family)
VLSAINVKPKAVNRNAVARTITEPRIDPAVAPVVYWLMPICVRTISFAVLSLGAATAFGQQNKPADGPPVIVQPGAPGQPSKKLTPATATARTRPRTPAPADVAFMQGMIHHHSQAVEMVALLKTRGQSPALQAFGERITISQSDEILFMKKWLTDRGKPVTMGHDMSNMGDMKGMDHSHMDAMPLMPGMLTPEQMAALAAAKGAEFDRLFLTGMIQHHTGALTMVDDLFNTPGAGQDPVLFDFATDVTNTQSAEIKIMQGMLEEKK